MSARIAPKTDTIGIAFSPHLPRFNRPYGRKDKDQQGQDRSEDEEPQRASEPKMAKVEDSLPPALIFEAALLGGQQVLDPLTPDEIARRHRNEWSPPLSGFRMTDKTI